ncbi:MAG TPA: hypothetical protein VNF91_05365, partial [Candidatus Acidoferrum sp.]|nr:hypothetical protein [Candidatus Acidoferrum sp.]
MKLHDEAWMPGTAPLDLVLRTLERHARAGIESVLKVCQGNYLDSTFHAIGAGHLADTDHPRAPPFRGARDRGSWRVSG